MDNDILVCRVCGEEADGSAHKMCNVAEDGEHHLVGIYPDKVVRAETLFCELCGKEWKNDSACEIAKDGRHRYKLVEIKFQRLPITNQSILKEGS